MEHEFEDVCVTGVEKRFNPSGDTVTISVEPKNEPDGEPLSCIYLNEDDISLIAAQLDLIVYRKNSNI